MATKGMPMMGGSDYQGDAGDESDRMMQCEQDIEDLESRVAAIEAKLGIQSPADEQEPMAGKTPAAVGSAMKGGKKPFFGGAY